MQPTNSVDLSKMSPEDLTDLRSFTEAQITIANYQKNQSDKRVATQLDSLAKQITAIDAAIAAA